MTVDYCLVEIYQISSAKVSGNDSAWICRRALSSASVESSAVAMEGELSADCCIRAFR